ncbi:MAG: MBL fold metallo-hydrolase, partial [Methanobrevibacter sp.]|nr:MBL fold metallo-hydrolase [Methanobrevibacter sp.]
MNKKILGIFLVLIIAVVLLISLGASELELENVLNNAQAIFENDLGIIELHFIDVGQGDSTLVILPNGKTMLIDAGTSDKGSTVVSYIKSLNVSKIDYLVMTHPDADHIGGMSKVIDNFDIGNI